MKKYIFILLCIYSIKAMSQNEYQLGKVDRVIDGDSYIITMKYRGALQGHRVRLVNADCPEVFNVTTKKAAQPYSENARSAVKNLIEGKDVKLLTYGKDKYDRILVFIYLENGKRLDDVLLANGLAWYYHDYHIGKRYKEGKKMMEKAKDEKAGLWADENPVKPSDWRKK